MDANSTPTLKDLAIGVPAVGEREEFDSMGKVEVPADRYWGAQTQRSLQHFSIGDDRMPKEVYHAYGYVKKAARWSTQTAGRLPDWKAEAIVRAADETIAGKLDDAVPALRLADRVGHAVQHEHQRGDLEPGHPAARRRARHPAAGRPERRRQHGPVVATTRSRPRCTSPRSTRSTTRLLPQAALRCAPTIEAQGEAVDGRRQDRPHPPRGRRAADRRPGVVRLGGAARAPRIAEVERSREGLLRARASAAPPSAPG